MFNNIMAPYDGTAFGRDGLFRALRIATRSKARLHIIHVEHAPTVVAADDSVAALPDASGRNPEVSLSELYAFAADCRAHATIEVTAAVEYGPVADALRGYALRNGVDLIVMSSHGRGGLARAWLGSVADRLIRDTGLPVLVVRPPSVASAATGNSNYRRVLVPLDGSQIAEESVPAAVKLATTEDATITLLRVVREREQIDDGVLQSARGRASAGDVDEAERYLARLAARPAYSAATFETKVSIGRDIPDAIIAFAASGEFDVVAIATRGRGGVARLVYGSVADRVLRGSMISTLVMHPPARQKTPEVAFESGRILAAAT